MEKDDEVKGRGNSLDFGTRMYDSRLGRFLSIDPMQSKYLWQSPYVYAVNKPINHLDNNGESGKVTITGDKNEKTGRPIMKVETNLFLYGSGATEERRAAMEKDLNSQYNNDGDYFTYKAEDGTVYDLQFEFVVEVHEMDQIDSDIKNSGIEDNFYIVENPTEAGWDYKGSQTLAIPGKGGNLGQLSTLEIDRNVHTTAHEINHGYDGHDHAGVTVKPGETPSISIPKGAKDSEGNSIKPEDRKVTQGDIDHFMRNVTFNEKGVGSIGFNLARGGKAKPAPKKSEGYEKIE